MQCPHCKQRAIARSSKHMSPVFREITFTCRNLQCGHVYVAGLEALRTLSPSAAPDPEIDIPFARNVLSREIAQQMLRQEDANAPA